MARVSQTPAALRPRRPMITHAIDQFILDTKPVLSGSSNWIPSQNKTKWKLQI